jgi:pyrimidine operon attenuation protein / uracil phosphoribosyltransferase
MIILDHGQICTIVKRMAIQILENHLGKDIVLCGINQKGFFLAEWIKKEMNYEQVSVHRIHINPADPTSAEISLTPAIESIENKQIIVVDDVGNTGRTLFYAMKPFMANKVSGIQAMLLVERMHKAFPIHTDYIGLQLATTLGENIEVYLDDPKNVFARLE